MQSENSQSGVEIVSQGSLLTVTPFNTDKINYSAGYTARGEINTFSLKSRKRLLELVARLQSPETEGYRGTTSFLTLTTQKILHPAKFKPLLFTWLKRLNRKQPRVSAIWRIEYQKRGATHAHLVLFNAPYINKKWIQETWGEVIDQAEPFTRIERINSQRKVMSYASKYIAKANDSGGFNNLPYLTERVDKATGEVAPLPSPGRQWGVFNRAGLPWSEHFIADIPLDGSWWLIRRYCQTLWGDLPLDDYNGFTIFCDEPFNHLCYITTMSREFISAAVSA